MRPGPDRSGRRDRRRGEGGRPRHHHRGEQMGPDEGAGPGRGQGLRREPALPAEVPGLRADPPHLGRDRRAHAEAARDDRQGRRGARTRVPTGELNRFIEKITTASPPVRPGKRNVRVMYAAQTSVAPPTFVLFTNVATKLHFSYERFLENRLARGVRLLRQSRSASRCAAGRTRERSARPRPSARPRRSR